MRHTLALHPACSTSPARAVDVAVERHGALLTFTYEIAAAADAIAVPAPAEPRRTDGLWKQTCCEAFIGRPGGAYAEFNFSPSGAWAAYLFSAPRTGMADLPLASPPRIACRFRVDRLELAATIDLTELPIPVDALALSVVVSDPQGAVSYWALAHPAPAPNFHHPDGFIARLPSAEQP